MHRQLELCWILKIIVKGIVQGVGFRPQIARTARSLGLAGYVRNVGSHVEIYIEGDGNAFLEEFKKHLPPLSRISSVEVNNEPPSMVYEGFEIAESGRGYKNYMFPSDTALCDECVNDIFEDGNRRYRYPFTNCVNCGARYSVIDDLPYDRSRTSMNSFAMCQSCMHEFLDDANRRYDAQTISCPQCGPKYTLYDPAGHELAAADPTAAFAHAIDDGKIGVVKSWGGMHITVNVERAEQFRGWYRRPTKPFAIMVRSAEAARQYVRMDGEEEKVLSSPERPIVLLEKRDASDPLLEAVSPGLPNVGVYLPYSGVHHILFSILHHDAIISTSANFPNEPMVVENGKAFSLGADVYLLHNRRIVNRTDDSVARVLNGRRMFIRKSRGFVPDILKIDYGGSHLSLGSEMNSRISITKDGYMFSSQYLGDISNYSSLMFMEETVHHFMKMLDVDRVDSIAVDMHPQFAYRRFAAELAGRFQIPIREIQHHHAHAASLMLDSGRSDLVAIALDGTGYGTDGSVWGGEILEARASSFRRIGSLEQFPLPGGEAAIRHPMRMVYAFNELLGGVLDLDYDRDLFGKLVGRSVKSSSFGRVLDCIAAYLGVCDSMHYDGEPAMRLERLLTHGRRRFEFNAEWATADGCRTVLLKPLFETLFTLKLTNARDRADAAYSMVDSIVEAMGTIASDHAQATGSAVGLTGGVSYNTAVNDMLRKVVEEPVLHSRIPNGDGGISSGQNIVQSAMME